MKEDFFKNKQFIYMALLVRGLSRSVAASYVGISTGLFDEWVKIGILPKGKKVGGRRLWDRSQIDLALDALFEDDFSENAWDKCFEGRLS